MGREAKGTGVPTNVRNIFILYGGLYIYGVLLHSNGPGGAYSLASDLLRVAHRILFSFFRFLFSSSSVWNRRNGLGLFAIWTLQIEIH